MAKFKLFLVRVLSVPLNRFRALAPITQRLVVAGFLLSLTSLVVGQLAIAAIGFSTPYPILGWETTFGLLVWGLRGLVLGSWSLFLGFWLFFRPAYDEIRSNWSHRPLAVVLVPAVVQSDAVASAYFWSSGYLFLAVAVNGSLFEGFALVLAIHGLVVGLFVADAIGHRRPRDEILLTCAGFGAKFGKVVVPTSIIAIGMVGTVKITTTSLDALGAWKIARLNNDGIVKTATIAADANVKVAELNNQSKQLDLKVAELNLDLQRSRERTAELELQSKQLEKGKGKGWF